MRLRKIPEELLERIRSLDLGNAWAKSTKESLEEGVFLHDPEFLERIVELMEIYGRYFDSEVRGVEHLPDGGPVLLVGNHSGPNSDPDTPALMAAWYRKNSVQKLLVVLSFDAIFAIPGAGQFFRRLGQMPANSKNAAAALDAGAAVLVYPGGTYEVSRPWKERNRIEFADRKGFIKVALRQQVPVIPVVGHGGHESSIVITRGQSIAKALGLDKLRLTELPIVWTLPWGFVLGPVPALIPLPAKVTLQICEPMSWEHLRPEDADNPEVLERCYQEITGVMQRELDSLAAENPSPILTRLRGLVRSRLGRRD